MKKFILLLTVLTTTSAFAETVPAVQKSRGRASVYNLIGSSTQAQIDIEGPAAQKLFDEMSIDLLQSIDAAENEGNRVVLKSGENVTCYMTINARHRTKYECTIFIENRAQGKIGAGGVG